MVQQVLQRFDFTYSSPQATPLSTRHSLSALPSDESVEPSGPYPELVGCLIEEGVELVLGGRSPVVLTGHADASWVDDLATQRSSQGYTFSLGSGSVSWRSTRSSSVLSSSCEAEIYAGAMAAQELRWLTYLLTDLGEPPCSPPVLYVDNKAMLALCREHRLEHRTKHIALCYFLARELQQRGQLRLAYVASQANTADIFTKALQPCDHQRFCTMLGCSGVADKGYNPIRPTPLAVDHGLTAPPSGKPFEFSGPYPELVGCLMYLMTCTHPDLAYPLSFLARFVAPGRHRPSHWYAAKRVANFSSEAEVYAAAMAAQELCWLSFLLTDLGEGPRSPPVLFANNRCAILLCKEPRPVGKAKHIQLRYFLLRELQRRGQALVRLVVFEANTANIFTKALPPSCCPAVTSPVFSSCHFSDLVRAAHPTIPCCLVTLVNAPASSPAASSALVATLAGFAAICRHAYLTGLVSASLCPMFVGGELALGCDVLEDRHFELEYLLYPLSIWTRTVASGRHHHAHWRAASRVLRYLVRLTSRT
ncbi:unnamed protein product [Closterium sp. NIES-54]